MRNRGALRLLLPVLAVSAAAAVAGPAQAQPALPGPAAADTVRTNLWLAEALFSDIAAEVSAQLVTGPARVMLQPGDTEAVTKLFQTALFGTLTAAGHEVFLPGDETGAQTPTHQLGFTVMGVDLDYPEVGRTLGLWRSWIGRDLSVSTLVELAEVPSGRLLLDRKIDRRYSDRFPDDDLPAVESPLYDFTSAELGRSGWQDRLEEVVVLSTLAGLVAVYFANTSD